MNDLPRISLVTPSYNQSQFLEQTLCSVVDQGYSNLEYGVIDGGSSDDSVNIIKRYSSRIDFWVSESDRGQAHAINKGFSQTSGEVMGWLNSDDILLPNTLKTVGTLFAHFPEISWITGIGVNIDAHGETISTTKPVGYKRDWIQRGWYHGRLLGFIRQESTFWRRSLWDRAGGYVNEDMHYGLDFDLWRRFASYADLVFVQAKLGAYRVHEAQKTATPDIYYMEIGVKTPPQLRFVTLPLRAMLTVGVSKFFPHCQYDQERQKWHFCPGQFFQVGVH